MMRDEWIPGDRFRNIRGTAYAEMGEEGVYLGPGNTLAWVLYDNPELRNRFLSNGTAPTGHTCANTKDYRTMAFLSHGELPVVICEKEPEPVPEPEPQQAESESLWSLPKTW